MESPPAVESLQADEGTAKPTVTADSALDVKLVEEVSALEIKEEDALPAHRSHDPQNNQKRSDPFMFGSRYLEEGDNVFEFNAWDHVEPDAAFYEYAANQYEMQRQHPVSDFDKRESSPHFVLPSPSTPRHL